MKYVSLLVVIGFIAFTFWFSRKSDDLTIEQMNRMNKMITQYMSQVVVDNNPNISEIQFSKIYTEVIEPGREMKAHFTFSYVEPKEEGEGERVHRKGTFKITSEDGLKWVAQIEGASDSQVEYLKPFEINAGEMDTSTDSKESSSESTEQAPE